jgi:tetratricopeptide (TPR) repeat protein
MCPISVFQNLLTVSLMPGSCRTRAVSALLLFCLAVVPALAKPSDDNAREHAIMEIQRLIESGKLSPARDLLRASTTEFGNDAGFDNLAGVIEAQEHHYSAAEANFKQAIGRRPQFTAAYLNLGRLYQENPATDAQARTKALHTYDKVLSYEPRNSEANYQSALLLLEDRKFRASLVRLSRLPRSTRESAQALSISCADHAGLGDRKNSSSELARFLEAPDLSEADVRQLLLGIRPGKDNDITVTALEGFGKRQRLPVDLQRSLGLAYEQSGRLDDARSIREKLAIDHMSVHALFDLARVAYKQKDYKGALGYLAHARDLEPDNASVHYSFGVVCLDLELLAEAQKSFEKAVKLDPQNSSYNYAAGATSLFSHDPKDAVPYFQQYLKRNPEDARGKLAVGIAFFRARDYEEAKPWLDRAAQRPETATSAHYYLGSLALQEGRLEDALPELQSALTAKPEYPDALAELGKYYFVRRNYAEAEKQLQRALKLNPDHMEANFYLLSLYARTRDPRHDIQSKRYEDLQKLRDTKSQELLRMVEVRPFEAP